ncbi:MAG: response regulator [Magnetococcales bacterium]|nr:response regulator [Magnetococcales bacterium]
MRTSILVVDDDPNNTKLLAMVLSPNHEVVIANSGEEALQFIALSRPDLILLDVMMPVMDGFTVCERLKANQTTCEIPVIFVTASGESIDETRGLEMGGEDYITKPFSPPVLRARVKNTLERTKLKSHLESLVEGLDVGQMLGSEFP